MRDDYSSLQSVLVTATAVRRGDESFQEYIPKADTAPPLKLTALRNESCSFVQPRKRLPLNMIISATVSRDATVSREARDALGTEQEHQTELSHIDNTSLHTLLTKKRGFNRCFQENSLVDTGETPAGWSEHPFSSEFFKESGNEIADIDCQTTFLEKSHSQNGTGSCSNITDVYYSTPCAKSRFNCLYGNEVINKNVKSNEIPGSHIHQTGRIIQINNDNQVPYVEKYTDGTKIHDYPSPSSAMPKHTGMDMCHEYDTEDTDDDISLRSHSLYYSPSNLDSPVITKGVSDGKPFILSSPLSSTLSSVNIYSDLSTEDEHEQANQKRKIDCDYNSEDCFLQPLAKFKSKNTKHQESQNSDTNLLYSGMSRSVSNWKPDTDIVNDPNTDKINNSMGYSIDNLPSMCKYVNSDALHDEVDTSADLTSWYKVKYARQIRTIRISTMSSGIPESATRKQIVSDLQLNNSKTECSPSDWDSLSENKEMNMMPYFSSPERY